MFRGNWSSLLVSGAINFADSQQQQSKRKIEKVLSPIVKVGLFQKVLAKFSNLSKFHSCEPKIVPELLIPVNDNNKILVILWIDLVIKSPHNEI